MTRPRTACHRRARPARPASARLVFARHRRHGVVWSRAVRRVTVRLSRQGTSRQRNVRHGRHALACPGTARQISARPARLASQCMSTLGRRRRASLCYARLVSARRFGHATSRLGAARLGWLGRQGKSCRGVARQVTSSLRSARHGWQVSPWQGIALHGRHGQARLCASQLVTAGYGRLGSSTLREGWLGWASPAARGKARSVTVAHRNAELGRLGGAGLVNASHVRSRPGRLVRARRVGASRVNRMSGQAWCGPVLPGSAKRGSSVHVEAGKAGWGLSCQCISRFVAAWLPGRVTVRLVSASRGMAGAPRRVSASRCLVCHGSSRPTCQGNATQGIVRRVAAGDRGRQGGDGPGGAVPVPSRQLHGSAGMAVLGSSGFVTAAAASPGFARPVPVRRCMDWRGRRGIARHGVALLGVVWWGVSTQGWQERRGKSTHREPRQAVQGELRKGELWQRRGNAARPARPGVSWEGESSQRRGNPATLGRLGSRRQVEVWSVTAGKVSQCTAWIRTVCHRSAGKARRGPSRSGDGRAPLGSAGESWLCSAWQRSAVRGRRGQSWPGASLRGSVRPAGQDELRDGVATVASHHMVSHGSAGLVRSAGASPRRAGQARNGEVAA